MSSSAPTHRFLQRMLERLYASLATGSSLNCRPHQSRQRVDLPRLSRLDGTEGAELLAALLGERARVQLTVPREEVEPSGVEPSEEQREAREALLRRLGTIVEDARTFEQDTGAHALHVGYPLLQLPPDRSRGGRRILAPVAFVPVRLTLKRGRVQAVELAGAGEGVDRVLPNTALLAWVEQQTGARLPELFSDEGGEEPWRELIVLCDGARYPKAVDAALLPRPGGGHARPARRPPPSSVRGPG